MRSVYRDTSSQVRAMKRFAPLQWIGANSDAALLAVVERDLVNAGAMLRRDPREILHHERSAHRRDGFRSNGSGACSASRGLKPVRVMVCHWSRTRPVFSTNGYSSRTRLARSGKFRRNEARLAIGVKNRRPRKTVCSAPLAAHGPDHRSSASYSSSSIARQAPRSKSRVPLVLERRQCGVLAEDVWRRIEIECASKPMRRATWSPSTSPGFASPAAAETQRWREMRAFGVRDRAVLLAPRGGGQKNVSTAIHVSFEATFSETTKSSSFFSASRTAPARGSDTAGLVAITHKALILPTLSPRTSARP
jgi:hypothetical protein